MTETKAIPEIIKISLFDGKREFIAQLRRPSAAARVIFLETKEDYIKAMNKINKEHSELITKLNAIKDFKPVELTDKQPELTLDEQDETIHVGDEKTTAKQDWDRAAIKGLIDRNYLEAKDVDLIESDLTGDFWQAQDDNLIAEAVNFFRQKQLV
jgi:hypothetical protein